MIQYITNLIKSKDNSGVNYVSIIAHHIAVY